MPGPGRPYHPGQFREPPTIRELERVREAKERGQRPFKPKRRVFRLPGRRAKRP
jgi:hypothetical protein